MENITSAAEIKFPLHMQRAIAVAAIIIKRAGKNGKISTRRLMKLLYLIERSTLEILGRPLIGGNYRAMPEGPVHSQLYRVIQPSLGKTVPLVSEAHQWRKEIKRRGTEVHLTNPLFSTTVISEREEVIIDRILHNYGAFTEEDLSEYTHSLPEWRNAFTRSCKEIKIQDIGLEVGCDMEKLSWQADKETKLNAAAIELHSRYSNMLRRLAQ